MKARDMVLLAILLVATGLATLSARLDRTPAQPVPTHAAELSATTAITATAAPRNVILMIGDGMGAEQIRAAGMYQNGAGGTLFMESLPYTSTISTHAADSDVTDSAASATAMATGVKVNNGVISMALPGDGSELETSGERFHGYCKGLGLVSTAYATHATPAAFAAHEPARGNLAQIADDYLVQTRPDVLMGGGGNGLTPGDAADAGYSVVTTSLDMRALDPNAVGRVSGQFGTTHMPYEYDDATGTDDGYDDWPHLTEMVTTALEILEDDPDGFFLMVESGRIDHAGHSNHLPRNVYETLEFDRAVEAVFTWAAAHTDTLILVTADHETGGLEVVQNNGAGQFPDVTWSTTGHTGVDVPVFGWGVNADLVPQAADNTDIYLLTVAGLAGAYSCTPTSASVTALQGETALTPQTLAGLSVLILLTVIHPRPGEGFNAIETSRHLTLFQPCRRQFCEIYAPLVERAARGASRSWSGPAQRASGVIQEPSVANVPCVAEQERATPR
jgi:alkaline phosphatase